MEMTEYQKNSPKAKEREDVKLSLLPTSDQGQQTIFVTTNGRTFCCLKKPCCSRRTKVIISLSAFLVGAVVTGSGAFVIPKYQGFPDWQLGAFIFLIAGLATTILGVACYYRHARARCQDLRECCIDARGMCCKV